MTVSDTHCLPADDETLPSTALHCPPLPPVRVLPGDWWSPAWSAAWSPPAPGRLEVVVVLVVAGARAGLL